MGGMEFIDFEHAWAQNPGNPSDAKMNPTWQPATFDRYNTDSQDSQGKFWNASAPRVTRALTNITPVVGPPWPFYRQVQAVANSGPQLVWANGVAGCQVNQPAGGQCTGSMWSAGNSRADMPRARSYAFSGCTFRLLWAGSITQPGSQWGVNWQPQFQINTSGSAWSGSHAGARDPVNVTVTNEAGDVLIQETPIDITALIIRHLDGMEGMIAWKEGRLQFSNIRDGEFEAKVASASILPSQRGAARLSVRDGVITDSYDDGIFNGLLPPVGMPGTFDVPCIYSIQIDYNFPTPGPANTELEMGGGSGYIPATSIASAKGSPDGTQVLIPGACVTAALPAETWFNIQEEDRSSGIYVMHNTTQPTQGARDDAYGTVVTDPNGERYIDAEIVRPDLTPPAVALRPLGMPNRSLGGADWFYDPSTGAGQQGVPEGTGLNSIGMLVRTWGRVLPRDYFTTFYVDDGSGRTIVAQVPFVMTLPGTWQYVAVTGACGRMVDPAEGPVAWIFLRDTQDLRIYPETP